jgi:colicin import membrane protein
VAAGAIGITVFLWTGTTEREERRFRQIQEQLDQAQKRLQEVGDRDGKARAEVMALLAEQKRLEEAKRRQEDEARKHLEEKQQLAEARLRKEEEARKRLEEKQRLAEAQLRKEEAARTRLEEQRRQEEAARRREEQERVALAKPIEPAPAARRSPQEEQLAMGEAALARREYDEAFKILQPLAQRGQVRAQDRLAEMYAGGMGVPKDNNWAYIWYSLAARGGSATASAERDRIARLLQPVEIQQADDLVKNWRAR